MDPCNRESPRFAVGQGLPGGQDREIFPAQAQSRLTLRKRGDHRRPTCACLVPV